MPPHCVFFFDILINVADVRLIQIVDNQGVAELHVYPVGDGKGRAIPILGVTYEKALADWRALFGASGNAHPHSHDHVH